MLLKSLKLENIRSYISSEINFLDGSTLLSGDIGCGKTTILLAVEFALFGILRGSLEGNSLLRKGKNEGSVELNINVDSKDVIIKRGLKRAKDTVGQDKGFVVVDGIKKEGTAVELKAIILDLLGYPREMLTKSKSLIYRFTVYTPQEQMKQILFEEKDMRLDTLRKVFGIDKYKRIRENIVLYSRELKQRVKECEGKIYDLEDKKKLKTEKLVFQKQIEENIIKLKPDIELVNKSVEEKKKNISEYEEKIKQFNELKQEYGMKNVELNNKITLLEQHNNQLGILDKEIPKLKEDIGDSEMPDIEQIQKEILEGSKKLEVLEKKQQELQPKISMLNAEINQANLIKEKVLKIDKCPTCEQDVNKKHKEVISKREDDRINKANEELKKLNDLFQKDNKVVEQLRKWIEALRQQGQNAEVLKLKHSHINEKTKQKKVVQDNITEIKKIIGEINTKKLDIETKMAMFRQAEQEYAKLRKEFDELLSRQREIDLRNNSLMKELENSKEQVDLLTKEINEKELVKKKIAEIKELLHWLDEYMVNLTVTMEKHVMQQIYHGFNDLFTEWFNILIDDETINVRLDDDFTPVVEQNGYNVELDNLSGGEKTSCALAYRLSLNKVINDMITTIKTGDIIILDEPTDGFSTEQLDKVRDILDELGLKQVIIVSHETKIESFVENVVRIAKSDHVSSVV